MTCPLELITVRLVHANGCLLKITNDPGRGGGAGRACRVVLAAHVIDELLLTGPAAEIRLIHDSSPVNQRLTDARAEYTVYIGRRHTYG